MNPSPILKTELNVNQQYFVDQSSIGVSAKLSFPKWIKMY